MMINEEKLRAAIQISLGGHNLWNQQIENDLIHDIYALQPKPEKDDLSRSVMLSLPANGRKAIEVFAEVCNEPIPIGEGKEYLDGMNKMKAFMAGRLYQESLKSNEA